MNRHHTIFCMILISIGLLPYGSACAKRICPFCTAIGPTLTEQFAQSKYAVVAKLESIQLERDPQTGAPVMWGVFRIIETINDGEILEIGQVVKMRLRNRYPASSAMLIFGRDQKEPAIIRWSAPKMLDKSSVEFVENVRKLSDNRVLRLRFFVEYLNDENSLIADDAFNELSQATYQDLTAIRMSISREHLWEWILDPNTPTHRLRLYYTMLGLCAIDSDADELEDLITSDDRQLKRGLDSLVACYLKIKGKAGLDVIDEFLIRNKKTTQTELFAVVGALRFHGTDVSVIPKERLLQSARLFLDRPDIADVMIVDLARWGDWSIADKLLGLYQSEKDEHRFLRMPIAAYFLSFPISKSRPYLKKLKIKDLEAFERAESWLNWENEKE